jgi:alpha/beta superfamily hydrolase
MELPMVAELAWALHRAGHATIRFNPRGLGASQGELGGHATHVADSKAALALLLETEQAPQAAIVAVGEGALVGLELARAGACAGLVLVAPPLELAAALVAGATPPPPMHVLLAQDVAWPKMVASVEHIEHADAAFLRGLPALGKAAAAFVTKLGTGPVPA